MYTLLYVCVALWWAVAIVHETNDQYKMCDYKEWYMSVYIILCIMQVCANFYRRVRSRQRELNLVYGSIRNDTSWKEKMYSAISFILLCTSNVYLWVAVGFIISWSPLHCFLLWTRVCHAERHVWSQLLFILSWGKVGLDCIAHCL